MWGSRVSLAVGVGAAVLTVLIGSVVGSVSGYLGGIADQLAMRVTDVVMSIPPVLLILLIVAIFGGGLALTIFAIGLVSWPGTARLLRGEFLRLRDLEFVEASRVIGVRPIRIVVPPHPPKRRRANHRASVSAYSREHSDRIGAQLSRPWCAASHSLLGQHAL